jgi:hypothetical protein
MGAIFASEISCRIDDVPGTKSTTFFANGDTNSDSDRRGMYSPKGVNVLFTYVDSTSPSEFHKMDAFFG